MSASPRRDWRLLVDPAPLDGPGNMALDAALLESVRAGAAPVVRLYRWDPPTLSVGRNQPARALYDEAAAAARGIGFVRRPTGGQSVLHADELTYAVVAPVEVIGRPREAYRRINEALVAALRGLRLPAGIADGAGAGAEGAAVDWTKACFARPAPGEVVVAGRKLVGSAQRCEGRVLLQHGSILVGGSQAAAEELLEERRAAPDPRAGGWTTLTDELQARPSWSALESAVVGGFEATFGTALAPARLFVDESKRADELRERYASPEWTWRR